MKISKVGPTIVLHEIPRFFWFLSSVWMLLFSFNEGVELYWALVELFDPFDYSQLIIPKPVDRSI